MKKTPLRLRKKAGILVFTIEHGELVAHLQQRGRYDYRNAQLNTWPGVCQVTSEGKRKIGEDTRTAALREIGEELLVNSNIMTWMPLLEEVQRHVIYRDRRITTFGILVPKEAMKSTRLENLSGGLIPIKENDLGRLITAIPEWRQNPHPCRYIDVVVFPEVMPALRKGFAMFKRHARTSQ